MNSISWFTVIRPANLAIIAITQYFINVFLLIPNFEKYGIYFSLDAFHFFLLVLSTVLICAGGYIINDYYDIKIDAVNKPEKQIVGTKITLTQAVRGYWILTVCSLALGIYLGIKVGNIQLATIHGVCILLLYFYSYSYKKIPLLGNVIVALMTAFSILIIGAFEPHTYDLYREADYYIAGLCWKYMLGLSAFAFLLTIAREIVKDIEDIEGDNHHYVNSIPIAWGMKTAKGIIFVVLFLVIAGTAYLLWVQDFSATMIYLFYGIILMLFTGGVLYLVLRAEEKKDFSRLSKLLKINMILGILFLPVYYLTSF